MADRREEQFGYGVNAVNPNQLEMLLSSSGPGAPESLEEAARRVMKGEPLIPKAEQAEEE